MDRNSLIGIGIIGAILIGWMYFSGPNKEELAAQKRMIDSIAMADSLKAVETAKQIAEAKAIADTAKISTDTSKTAVTSVTAVPANSDSLKAVQAAKVLNDTYRDFAASSKGSDTLYSIENNLIKAIVSSKGGKVVSVELKEYNRPNEPNPLVLFNGDSLTQSLEINAYNSMAISTDSLYFVPEVQEPKAGPGTKAAQLTMRMKTSNPASYIDFVYKLKQDSYTLDYDVVFSNMQGIVSSNRNDITMNWGMQLPTQELHIEKEKQTSGIFYQTIEPNGEAEVDNMSLVSSEEKSIPESELKWVAFKQQFFSSVLIAKTKFIKGSLFNVYVDQTNSDVVKSDKATLGFMYEGKPSETFSMQFFYGPNQYHVLKDQNLDLEQMIPMGWSVFKYLNKWLVVPIFNAFKDSSMSMGWVILILTLIIKILLLPIAYKTYLSSAKMRLLKPEIDAIKAKHGTDTMKVNQENMALYKKAGASPLSGCIPALLQLPILIALLNFFPASFELRQKEFLWATDLSTYDSVWDFGVVPVINTIYGDHMSLFALLMFVSTMVYTWMNQKMMPMNNQQMPGMQVMMYLMPVIFLSFMNSYSAGLSWYYFLANMITFLQTFLFRKLVSDDKLRAKINDNMKKPIKKSGFQQRLEQMQKQQAAAKRK
ncbi:MAG: Membrane protein oxaA [Bacteroidetes bacterium]|jgi:YidC/Oxa1 family membrane protein insertase|nr:Membrane protein oxaA [Bacteroidota bacterium]